MIQPMNPRPIQTNTQITTLQNQNNYIAEPIMNGKRTIISKLNNHTKILYTKQKTPNPKLINIISSIKDDGFILDGIYTNKKYFIIDILMYNRTSLDLTPLMKRKKLIEEFLNKINNPSIKQVEYTTDIEHIWKLFKNKKGIIIKHKKSEYHTGTINYGWMIKEPKTIHKIRVYDFTTTKTKKISNLITPIGKIVFPSKRFKNKEEELITNIPKNKVTIIIESYKNKQNKKNSNTIKDILIT